MYQKTTVIGYVGHDAEMRYAPDGTAVSSFSVAHNRTWVAEGQKKEKTVWFRVSCWGKLAETVAQYVRKGMLVFVEGEVEAAAYQDKTGKPAASLELRASTVKFLSRVEETPEEEGSLFS